MQKSKDIKSRYQEVSEILLEGVSAKTRDEMGQVNQITDWSPNNLKTLIVCRDRVIIEHHVAPLGRMTTKLLTKKISIESLKKDIESVKNGKKVKGVLKLLGQDRVFSNVEEIIIMGTGTIAYDMVQYAPQDLVDNRIVGENTEDKIKLKYCRLYAISLIKAIDGEQLYRQMLHYLETHKNVHWTDVFKKFLIECKYYHKKDWAAQYELRYKYYTLDRTPTQNIGETSTAQLYTYFNTLKESYVKQEKTKQEDKDLRQNYKNEMENVINKAPWLIETLKAITNITQVYLKKYKIEREKGEKLKWYIGRKNLIKNPLSTNKVIEVIQVIMKYNVGVELNESKYIENVIRQGLGGILIGDLDNEYITYWLNGKTKDITLKDITSEQLHKLGGKFSTDLIELLRNYIQKELSFALGSINRWLIQEEIDSNAIKLDNPIKVEMSVKSLALKYSNNDDKISGAVKTLKKEYFEQENKYIETITELSKIITDILENKIELREKVESDLLLKELEVKLLDLKNYIEPLGEIKDILQRQQEKNVPVEYKKQIIEKLDTRENSKIVGGSITSTSVYDYLSKIYETQAFVTLLNSKGIKNDIEKGLLEYLLYQGGNSDKIYLLEVYANIIEETRKVQGIKEKDVDSKEMLEGMALLISVFNTYIKIVEAYMFCLVVKRLHSKDWYVSNLNYAELKHHIAQGKLKYSKSTSREINTIWQEVCMQDEYKKDLENLKALNTKDYEGNITISDRVLNIKVLDKIIG